MCVLCLLCLGLGLWNDQQWHKLNTGLPGLWVSFRVQNMTVTCWIKVSNSANISRLEPQIAEGLLSLRNLSAQCDPALTYRPCLPG